MSKADYKGYELIKAIHDGKIKDGKIIEVHDLSTLDHVKARIEYSNKRLNWIAGEFDTGCLFDDNIYFKILEDNTEEIEEIGEISDEYFIMLSDEAKVKWLKSYIKEDRNKINELVKAVNKLRKDKNNE